MSASAQIGFGKEPMLSTRNVLRKLVAAGSAVVVLAAAACGTSTGAADSPSSAGGGESAAQASSGGPQAGDSTKDGPPASASQDAQPAQTDSGQAGSGDPVQGPVTLKIINWVNPPANKAIKEINKKFEAKYPNIKVDYQISANTTGAYATLLQTTVTSHSADIITTNYPFQPLPLKPTRDNMTPEQLWATSGLLLPLNDQPWLKNYTQAARDSETYQGKVYGVLSGVYQWMVFYNKAIFKKYNLAVPHTYTDFIKVMDTLKDNGVTPLWLGTGGGAAIYIQEFMTEPLMSSIWAPKVEGGDLAKALESGAEPWNSPHFVEVMTKQQKIASYLEPGYSGISWQGMPGAFAAGKSAMLLDGSWDLAAVHDANPGMEIGSFPMPGSDTASDNQSLLSNDLTFEVLKDAPHKDAALKYLEFFSQPEIYKDYVNITGISPSQSGGTYSSFASTVLGDQFGKGVSTNTIFPILSAKQGYYCQPNNFPTVQADVIAGKKTPQQAADLYHKSCKTTGS